MRVLVCGGRNITAAGWVYGVLDKLSNGWPSDIVIIEGDARGLSL